jgi:hypothetical protein
MMADTRNRPERPLRERLHAGEPTVFCGPARAGDRDGISVAERRARSRLLGLSFARFDACGTYTRLTGSGFQVRTL